MKLRVDVSKSEAGIKMLLSIMLLRSDAFDNSEEWADFVPGDRTEAVKQATDELHVTILAMAGYWKSYGVNGNVESRWRGGHKVGRNEPPLVAPARSSRRAAFEA